MLIAPPQGLGFSPSIQKRFPETDEQNFIKYHKYDSFNRADSSSSIGSDEITGQAYTILGNATLGISSNQAYTVTNGRTVVVQDCGLSNCIIETNMTVDTEVGMALRVVDVINYLYIRMEQDSCRLYEYVDDNATVIDAFWASGNIFTNIKLTVVLNNANIKIFIDNILVIDTITTTFLTATKHGLWTRWANSSRWKTFSIMELKSFNNMQITEGFEGALPWYWTLAPVSGQSWSRAFDTSIYKKGTKSLRIELRKTDPDVDGSKRSEINLPTEKPLEEHWYGFSIYLPNGGADDYANDPDSGEILVQWHNSPDSGEAYTSPPLALFTSGGNWGINRYWDDARITTTQQMIAKGYQAWHDLGSYSADKGKWTDWIFHVKWGWLKSQNPILEVYKNGVLVLEQNGLPNMTNDGVGVYWKLGIYKWDWAENDNSILTKRVVYFDDIKIK